MPRLALLVWLLLVARWTLTPAPHAVGLVDLTPWWCISCGEAGTADLFQNLLLFLPIGLALRAIGWRLPRTAAVALLLTLGIELTQAALLPGRDAALGDLLANTIGAVIGWLALPALAAVLRPEVASNERLAAIVLVLFGAQLAASAWLLRPSPGTTPWHVEAAPPRPDGTIFPGQVLEADLTSTAAATTYIVSAIWDTPTAPGMTTIARLTRSELEGVAGTSVGDDMVSAGMRTRASAVRLRSPIVTVPLPALQGGDTLQVRLTHSPGSLALAANGSAEQAPLGAQHGWLLINPFSQRVDLGPTWQRWTLAWLIGWGVLLGWGAGAALRWVGWAVGGGTLALVVPLLSRTPLGATEWLALAGAWAVSAIAGRMRRGVSPRG